MPEERIIAFPAFPVHALGVEVIAMPNRLRAKLGGTQLEKNLTGPTLTCGRTEAPIDG